MSAKSRKSQKKETKKKKEVSTETVILSQILNSITSIHETTDRKLSEMVNYCSGKKCNEQT